MKRFVLLLMGLVAVWNVAAKVELPEQVGSNMVLQQNASVRLWGWADPRAAVRVSTTWGAEATAKCDRDGRSLRHAGHREIYA